MINRRSVVVVIFFLILSIVVVIHAFNIQASREKNEDPLEVEAIDETRFKNIFYYVMGNDQPEMTFTATELNIIGNIEMFFSYPNGQTIVDNEWMNFKALKGRYGFSKKEMRLNGKVNIEQPHYLLKSNQFYFNGTRNYLESRGGVLTEMTDKKNRDKITIKASALTTWMDQKRSLFTGNVEGELMRTRRYEGGFLFSSDRLEINQLTSLVTLNNNVNMDRNNYHLQGHKAEIFLDNFNKKLKYYVFYDDIKLVEKLELRSGGQQIRKAFAERLEGYIAEGKIVLSGAPRVEQGDDIIKGYQITLRENVEIVEVDDSQSSFNLKKDK